MTDIRIRPVDWDDPADCTAVVELLDAYSREPLEGGRPLSSYAREHVVDGLRQQSGAIVLLAWINTRVVGIAVCYRGFSTFAARPLLNLHDLAVLSDFRNRGVGSRLLEAVCGQAADNGCCKVTLEVRADNHAAESLYRRHGFGDPGGKPTRFLAKPL
jgi:ribosomal protein S18 acetylase RimI-like enzyme